ncbi:hypothetical protein LPJ61_004879, partial [Coemansia biformis]
MELRTKLLVALSVAALALGSAYILFMGVPLFLRDIAPGASSATVDRSPGIVYYLPVARFTDNKYIRMNTILNKAVKVCDTKTLKDADKETLSHLTCDVTVKSDRGWSNLCPKTKAMIEHVCAAGGIGNKTFFAKVDDDTIVDPRVEDYIMSNLSGRDIYFGFRLGAKSSMTNDHSWFDGPFYGLSASVLKKVCQCKIPDCRQYMGEDQWTGYMLGECNITKEDA